MRTTFLPAISRYSSLVDISSRSKRLIDGGAVHEPEPWSIGHGHSTVLSDLFCGTAPIGPYRIPIQERQTLSPRHPGEEKRSNVTCYKKRFSLAILGAVLDPFDPGFLYSSVPHPAQLPIEQLLKHCQLQRTRGSGPGGQHRNKVETAIVVQHLPSGLRGEASERRSQQQNRVQAIHRLRVKLALEVRCTAPAEPSSAWQCRVKTGRISINPAHEEFPALLAEALDIVFANDFAIPAAATNLEVTASQLVKLLKLEPQALGIVNRERASLGLPALR